MADSLYYKHGTSDEYNDPFCDVCFETKGHNVNVFGYCQDCFQFLCADCHVFHKHFQGTKHHIVLRGTDMPQSQAAKPPRFESCEIHSKQVKDQFCSGHCMLLCLLCASSEHKCCSVSSIEDTCKNINASEINALYDNINKYKQCLDKTVPSVVASIDALKEEKKNMLKEAHALHDKIITKASELFQGLTNDIEAKYQSQLSVLLNYQKQINTTVAQLASPLNEIDQLKGQTVDTKVFLKVQDTVSFTKKICTEVQDLNEKICTVSLSLVPSKHVQDFLSSTTMGSVSTAESKFDTPVITPDITFPVLTTKPLHARKQSARASGSVNKAEAQMSSKPLSKIKATRKNMYEVKLTDDKTDCLIVGITIMKDGRRILVDNFNCKMKMYSRNMALVSSLSLPDKPGGVAVSTDSDVVVSTGKETLVVVGISNKQLNIKQSHKLSFNVHGIIKCNDKFVVTCADPKPASVKLIDLAGNVYWSLSHDQQGQPLFDSPWYLSHHTNDTSSTVIVSDYHTKSLTLVNGETGEVMTRRQLKNNPRGVTTDNEGNIYVCYSDSNEVAVLSRDLSEERLLLSRQDGIEMYPLAIAYDDAAHVLVICYYNRNTIDFLQLK